VHLLLNVAIAPKVLGQVLAFLESGLSAKPPKRERSRPCHSRLCLRALEVTPPKGSNIQCHFRIMQTARLRQKRGRRCLCMCPIAQPKQRNILGWVALKLTAAAFDDHKILLTQHLGSAGLKAAVGRVKHPLHRHRRLRRVPHPQHGVPA